MKKIEELKNAVNQLEVDVAALKDAEQAVKNWQYGDLHRQDGSSAQDARHERMGREAHERVSQASQKVCLQKALIAKLTNEI